MTVRRPSRLAVAAATLALALPVAGLGPGAPAARASSTQESTFQDDNLLVYAPLDAVAKTLDQLKAMGVDRIRVSVFWAVVAPNPHGEDRPSFNAADPAAYPPGAWDRYDTIVRDAAARGIGVNFDVTSPAPSWATGNPARKDIEPTFDPRPQEFGQFVQAVATRYSGQYVPAGQSAALPRVSYWSVWNEPNHPGWLTPQWAQDPRDPKAWVQAAPRVYRTLVDAAWSALQATGHGGDTILIGETAPKGPRQQGQTRGIPPLPFIRQLYCVDDHLQFLQGTSAELAGCPVTDQARAFVSQHPGLFQATGWSHHPYELSFAPDRKPASRDFVTIANLSSLSGTLRRIRQRYAQPVPRGGVPLYLTEFGYQTDPPDPTGVSLDEQAAYLNQAEYIAYRNTAVRTLAQFLLVDDTPVEHFQSGLETSAGKAKPALAAYRLPIWLPQAKVAAGRKLHVWGLVRGASNGTAAKVSVQVRPRGTKRWRRVATVTAQKARGYVDTRVKVSRSGAVRLVWGATRSRAAAFTVTRRR